MQSAAILGAGASGFLHALALRSAGVRIAVVFDPDRKAARNLTELVGGEACSSFEDIHHFDTDIAAVCSPPIHHVTQAAALANGKRLVFVEKPVALDDDELARLRALPRVVPIVQWRAGRSARELRAATMAGVFGPRPRVQCELRLWRDAAYFARRDRAQWGCGAMLSIGIHALDLVLWILQRRVVGSSGREHFGRQDLDVSTGGEITLDFEGGAHAQIAISLDEVDCDEVRMAVEGAGTTAWLHTHEADPTATPLLWRGVREIRAADAGGASGSPLLVPFIHEALGIPSASCTTLASPSPLSVDDVAEAHRLAYAITCPVAPRALCRRRA